MYMQRRQDASRGGEFTLVKEIFPWLAKASRTALFAPSAPTRRSKPVVTFDPSGSSKMAVFDSVSRPFGRHSKRAWMRIS